MKRELNEGDFFKFNVEGLKKVIGSNNKKAHQESILDVIDFFEKNNIDSCKISVVMKDSFLYFSQYFFDENGNEIDPNVSISNAILLNIDSVCEKVESHYSEVYKNNVESFFLNDIIFNDGDMFSIPLSALENRNRQDFSDSFNSSIDGALKIGLKYILMSFHYELYERKNSDDDLNSYFSGFEFYKYDYSQFSPKGNPKVRLFLTDNLGQTNYTLGEVSEEDHPDITNQEKVEKGFFSLKEFSKKNSKSLNFMSTLTNGNLKLLTNIKEVKKEITLIGNYHSEEFNFLGMNEMLVNFSAHQRKKMVDIEDVEFVIFKREELSKEEQEKLEINNDHLILYVSPNENNKQYTDIFKIEPFGYQIMKKRMPISIFEFNKILSESSGMKILTRSNRGYTPLEFEYEQLRIMSDDKSKILKGIKKGSVYLVNIKEVLDSIKDETSILEFKKLSDIGVSQFFVSFYSPHHFLMTDQKIENNNFIYINGGRSVEARFYPISDKEYKSINMEMLSLMSKEEQKEYVSKIDDYKNIRYENNLHIGDFIANENIKLNTFETLNFIKNGSSILKLIKDKSDSYFHHSNAFDEYMLKSIRIGILNLKEKEEKEKRVKNKPF